MKDQGKISELNKSSHRYQTSYSEGQQSEVHEPQAFALGPLKFHHGSPPSTSAAQNSEEESSNSPRIGGLQRTKARRLRRKRAKAKRINAILASLPDNMSEEEREQHLYPQKYAQAQAVIARKIAKQQKHRAYLVFLAAVAHVKQHKPLSNKAAYDLFSLIYEPDMVIRPDTLDAVNLEALDYIIHKPDIPPEATINHDLFPPDRHLYTPQSGTITPPLNPFLECSDAIYLTYSTHVNQSPYLAWLVALPKHYLLIGSVFLITTIFRMCRDIILTTRFLLGCLFGYRLVHYRYKYTAQSGSLDNAKIWSQYLSKVSTVASALIALVTLVVDTRKKTLKYSPQTGFLSSDDGDAFVGKSKAKVSAGDKPEATPGVTISPSVSTQQQEAKPPAGFPPKTKVYGSLNGFSVGI